MIFLVAGCFVLLAAVIAWQAYAADKERAQFASERAQWTQERKELLTRIQAPEAASFMFEDSPEDAKDDLPLMPTAEFDPQEVEKAREHLAEVGYDEGPGL